MANTFRILSIDGGGLRGIIPVLVLKEIERRTGKRIADLFDMVAGTSTGGLITCALVVSDDGKTSKYSLSDIEKVYTDRGKEIFPQKGWFKKLVSDITSLKSPKYSPDGLQKVLTDMFGQKRITDCIRPIFVTSFDLYNNEALLFKYRHAINDPASNALLIDVCRATSAAPTYLPAYDMNYEGKRRVCVDGGIYMNNPSVGAMVEVVKYHQDPPYNLPVLGLDNASVLSLGTGHYTPEIARQNVEGWGLLDWAGRITDVMMQAVNQTTTYETEELTADGHFLRINLNIDDLKHAGIDDSSGETQNYLINLVNTQIFGNQVLMNNLDTFLKNNSDRMA